MGGQITRNTFYDSINGQFPATTRQCHHKQKRCLPSQHCGGLSSFPLLFHPSTKGSQIIMDMSQRTVKRHGSFCNAITFSNRPIAVYEQVRLKITKKQCCWSGALRIGFTSKDPSRINPDSLPKYACPDLVLQSGFWAKALPEELSNEGNVVSFWVDKKGRVFYRINESSPMLFFSGVHASEPLWALIDVYGLTRGIQLLDTEMINPDFCNPRNFAVRRLYSVQQAREDPRLSISLCDLSLQQQEMNLETEEEEQSLGSSSCHVPQNSQNSQQCSLLPSHMDSDLHFHSVHGVHVTMFDKHMVARRDHRGDDRTLVFTSRPVRCSETVFIKVSAGMARPGCLSYGVTSCNPAALRPSDLPSNPESLVDRKEFWAVCRVAVPLHNGDILGFVVNSEGEVIVSHNGVSAGMQLCVDNSRPLWMFYGLHNTLNQLRILGSSPNPDQRSPSLANSSPCSPISPSMLCCGPPEPNMDKAFTINLSSNHTAQTSTGTTPSSPFSSLPESPNFPCRSTSLSDECAICYENMVDTVLYACGHMCLCYTCGLKLKKMSNACCPICRSAIKDIIKTYRST
ncbi:neuralized E3 ubiquitin protein ligase 1Ab [Synchiropus splendidus]|uniref:neuralized E3 ubiquitin protein ligase 1Ab n=1 Tax=Synchiropus splendidus TaxID=270530 RepID=UPI00237E3D54|nr:neuralized E3 ubiquitin protein ligase 1Ab [Synchiropus splendidus]